MTLNFTNRSNPIKAEIYNLIREAIINCQWVKCDKGGQSILFEYQAAFHIDYSSYACCYRQGCDNKIGYEKKIGLSKAAINYLYYPWGQPSCEFLVRCDAPQIINEFQCVPNGIVHTDADAIIENEGYFHPYPMQISMIGCEMSRGLDGIPHGIESSFYVASIPFIIPQIERLPPNANIEEFWVNLKAENCRTIKQIFSQFSLEEEPIYEEIINDSDPALSILLLGEKIGGEYGTERYLLGISEGTFPGDNQWHYCNLTDIARLYQSNIGRGFWNFSIALCPATFAEIIERKNKEILISIRQGFSQFTIGAALIPFGDHWHQIEWINSMETEMVIYGNAWAGDCYLKFYLPPLSEAEIPIDSLPSFNLGF